MPITHGTRTIAASRQELWDVLGDPHHLPRWWPRVSRVEAVDGDAFTEVLMSPKGKVVRADFTLVESVECQRIVWSQQIEGTPFERILQSAETEIELTDADVESGPEPLVGAADVGAARTSVTIELRQTLRSARIGDLGTASQTASVPRLPRVRGVPRFGSFLVRRAADSTIEEALDGLQRIVGRDAR